ncbi:MAG TPA: hypothetical protein PKD18_20005 [Saprospiraceae bacterium]|nr:hypothetical protein [Saprospiraceae bacterium]
MKKVKLIYFVFLIILFSSEIILVLLRKFNIIQESITVFQYPNPREDLLLFLNYSLLIAAAIAYLSNKENSQFYCEILFSLNFLVLGIQFCNMIFHKIPISIDLELLKFLIFGIGLYLTWTNNPKRLLIFSGLGLILIFTYFTV